MILNDNQIIEMCEQPNGMIQPYIKTSEGGVSYGISSYGYDLRLSTEFVIFNKDESTIIDPLNPFLYQVERYEISNPFTISPKEFILAETFEKVNIPRDVIAVCIGKSTYARCGLFLNTTPIEPGFQGTITLELYNSTDIPIKIYPMLGICQLVFFKGKTPNIAYDQRNGKYMHQSGVTLPK